jgi:hypothetical protein
LVTHQDLVLPALLEKLLDEAQAARLVWVVVQLLEKQQLEVLRMWLEPELLVLSEHQLQGL